jgi:hypothetical protein
VLEWQTLTRFIESDMANGPTSLCTFLYKFYEFDIPKTKYKVKVAKNKGELNSKRRAEYQDTDYDLSKWKYSKKANSTKNLPAISKTTVKAIDYIGM